MMSETGQLSRTSVNTLSAISRYRYQRRSGREWLIGDKRVSTATIADLERKAFVKEVAFNGTPVLVLTNEGKRLVAGSPVA